MQLTHYNPNPILDPFIKGYWLLEQSELNSPATKTLFPEGAVEIIFHLQTAFLRKHAGEWAIEKRMFIEGPHSGAIAIRQHGPVLSVGITMHPWAVSFFYDIAPGDLTDNSFSADLLDPSLPNLYNALAENAHLNGIDSLCDRYFMNMLGNKQFIQTASDSRFISLINRISTDKVLKDLKKEWGFSPRYFEQKCFQLTGMSASAMVKKRRMKKAVNACLNLDFTSFTDVAHACGYYDQSHFIKDFRNYFQQPPSQIFKNKQFFLRNFL